ncbi:MAG TPA: hypothetical protein VF699_08990 [Caulobacteraceae bacterium]
MKAAVVLSRPDTLDEHVARFEQAPLRETAFLNSIPKSGTHLLRNIVRMFVPIQQHYAREFIQIQNLKQHAVALDPASPQFSNGHLVFTDASAAALKHARQVNLVRDPYDYVLARARFILSDQFRHPLMDHLKGGVVKPDHLLNMMIFGLVGKAPALQDVYVGHALAWMGTGVRIVRYEDVVANLKALDGPEAEGFFAELLGDLGIASLPPDWRERVRIGSAREHSATAREHLSGDIGLPAALPETQRRLVDHAAPGLRALLGYEA